MADRKIYLWENGQHDPTRWLLLAHRGPDSCVLHLSNLCNTGRVSHLSSVSCPTSYLKECVSRGGALQLTLKNGFLLLHCFKEVLRVEFRANDDTSIVNATFLAAEVLDHIEAKDESERLVLSGT